MIVFVCHNFKRMDVYEGSTKPNFLYSFYRHLLRTDR